MVGGGSYFAHTAGVLPSQDDRRGPARDADYYVAPDGSDSNPGTAQAPFRTLSEAVSVVAPGQTILLRGGVYDRDDVVTVDGLRGTSEAGITIAGYPGERPVFSFSGPTPGGWDYDDGLVFNSVSHVTVENLTVRDSAHLGIQLTGDSSNNVFRAITVTHNNLVGFGLYNGVTENRLEQIEATHNYDRQNGGSDADGIQIANSDFNTVVDAALYENGDDGLDLWESRNTSVERTISYRNGRGEQGDGNGFKLGGGDGDGGGGQRIYRCVAFANRQFGFNSNGATEPISVYNNTAWNNPSNYQFYDGEHELANNISASGQVSTTGPLVAEHNSWNLGITEPGFRSVDPESADFLRLQASSPCIDAGREVDGVRHNGPVPDLGAFEHDS